MSDQRLRQLERAGTDRPRLLAERVRAGTLARDRLALAAQLGDCDARQVAGSTGNPDAIWTEDTLRLPALLERLRLPEKALHLGALAVARALLDPWEQGAMTRVAGADFLAYIDTVKAPREALRDMERWLADPIRPSLEAWRASFRRVVEMIPEAARWVPPPPGLLVYLDGSGVAHTAEAPTPPQNTHAAILRAAEMLGETHARQVLELSLIRWALLDAGPVRHRPVL